MIMHPAIKLRHIRAFLDIAVEGSLSAVARRQGITQPALSRTLAELEELLAVPLFRREKRRLVLSEQGALFRRHASVGLQAFEAGAAALHPGAAGSRIRVGVLPTAATRLFPLVALRFREIAPETVLTIETGPHSYLVGLLREGAIDLMLGRMPAASEMAGLVFTHLYEEEVTLVARHDHPLRDEPAAQLLQQVPVILPPDTAIIRRVVDEYLMTLNLAGLNPAFETVALPVGRAILLRSDAVWFISRGVVADELDRGELCEISTGARFLSGAVGLTRRQGGPAVPGLDLLERLTKETADRQA
ncbi:LysR family transcriptional regulator, pca operon transcriptional activator [Hyphomicrobiales bacterium]|nr:LysR family transcriptional regulator, pca operon transcriptional activator [Hyphomicrobiales bacterium]CAH1699218.1 LysR family transcriptional regulator, pca operon transcriptional activator [Hyphomicrobiales bacterium]CAI0343004.1 LysR family transcriptional regulator, pca operon transcriptional activator [Hyphomicrobiales bacterium]